MGELRKPSPPTGMMVAMTTTEPSLAAALPADVSVRRWALCFGAYVAAVALPTAWLLDRAGASWGQLFTQPGRFTSGPDQALKLLVFALYLSLCSSFVPLPTGWMVAAIATREVALTGQLWSTALLVGLVGAAGSTMANLNDYHLFALLLRHRRLAALRDTRLGRRSLEWFARAPFTLLVASNILPVPVDVVRVLAVTGRYGRRRFAAANFIGRFIRYTVLAGLAYAAHVGAVTATLVMLGLTVALAAARLLYPPVKAAAVRVWSRRMV